MDFKGQKEFTNYALSQHKIQSKKVKPSYYKCIDEGVRLSSTSSEAGNLKQAEQSFLRAIKIAEKNEYAKAAACHDLGVFYFTHFAHIAGAPHSNLKKAEVFFNRAIESKQRRQFPEKHAASLSQLGAAYRRAANEHLWHFSSQESLLKAVSLHKAAICVLEKPMPSFVRLNQLSVIYLNLSATLFDLGKKDEACDAQLKSYQCFMEALSWSRVNFPNQGLENYISMKPEQVLLPTFVRLNHFSQDEQHKTVCHEILEMAPMFGIDPSVLMGANPYLDISNPSIEIMQLVMSANKSQSDSDIKILSAKLQSLMKNRQSTETDQESDRVSVLIQQASSGLARVLVKKDAALRAFQTLENSSGMRFCESASTFWLYSKNPVTQVLLSAKRQLGSVYYGLNELALIGEKTEKKDLNQWLFDSALLLKPQEKKQFNIDNASLFDKRLYASIVESASKATDPVNYLKQKASICLTDFQKLGKLTDELDPDYLKARQRTYQITLDDLTEAIYSHPEQVLVKIDIEDHYDDALVIVAYLQNNEIIAKGYSFNMPKDLVNNIAAFVANNKDANIEWDLGFIDWKAILPSHMLKVSLLPSFFASHIPWSATGKAGEKLYHLVNEVNWLPSLMYLYHRVNYFDKKTCDTNVCGGGTLFENVAVKNKIICKDTQTIEDVVNQLTQSEVFSFYGHCEHKYPERPSLLFRDYTLRDVEMRDAVRGSERIELWACQSGANIPLNFFPSQVNEALGLDMRMLEYGAKTAIGSLWPIPEIVTAHIKSKYDSLVINGMGASEALLSAQQWWVELGADEELRRIKLNGEKDYLCSIGCNSANQSLNALMGPVLSGKIKNSSEIDFNLLEYNFKHPSAWAGLRFCGVNEQTNIFIPKVNLSSDERHQVNALLLQLNLKSGFVKHAR